MEKTNNYHYNLDRESVDIILSSLENFYDDLEETFSHDVLKRMAIWYDIQQLIEMFEISIQED